MNLYHESSNKKALCYELYLGSASVERTLRGKHFNHAMRVLEYAYDALMRLKILSLENWLLDNDKGHYLDRVTSSTEFNNCKEKVFILVYPFKGFLFLNKCLILNFPFSAVIGDVDFNHRRRRVFRAC